MQRWLAFCALALIAVTWPLWAMVTEFPRIPWFAGLRSVPFWCDRLALAGVLIALVAVLVFAPWRDECAHPWRQRAITALLVIAGVSLLILDQHRLQPWVWQFSLVILVLATARAERAMTLLRLLTVGIYIWSGLSKLDATFLTTIGPDLWRGLTGALSFDPASFIGLQPRHAAWLMPTGELIVAGWLAWPPARRFGLIGSVALHGTLLLMLGPWGLNHEPGVLLWNIYFIGQNVLLFGNCFSSGRTVDKHQGQLIPGVPSRWHLAETGVALALILPILEPFGWYDHWPAWSVYTPGAERVTLLVAGPAANQLPAELRRYLGPPDWQTGRQVLRTDLWSLERLGAPIYPQGRFRAAVAWAVIQEYELGTAAALVVESRADRFTGRRTQREIEGAKSVGRFVSSYWLNTKARGNLGGEGTARQ